jgi:hypothetical protein
MPVSFFPRRNSRYLQVCGRMKEDKVSLIAGALGRCSSPTFFELDSPAQKFISSLEKFLARIFSCEIHFGSLTSFFVSVSRHEEC